MSTREAGRKIGRRNCGYPHPRLHGEVGLVCQKKPHGEKVLHGYRQFNARGKFVRWIEWGNWDDERHLPPAEPPR